MQNIGYSANRRIIGEKHIHTALLQPGKPIEGDQLAMQHVSSRSESQSQLSSLCEPGFCKVLFDVAVCFRLCSVFGLCRLMLSVR